MKKGKLRSYAQIGFFISLILNIFLLGFIISGPTMLGLAFDPLSRIYSSAKKLTPESQEIVLNIIQKKQPKLQQNVKNIMKTFKAAREKLTSEGLTDADINKIREDMILNHSVMSIDLGDTLKEVATSIPDEKERIKFFDSALPKEPPFAAPFKKNATGILGQDR